MRRPSLPIPAPSRPRLRRLALLPVTAAVLVSLSGCSLTTFASMTPRLPALTKPTATPSPSPTTPALRKPGNLDTGSAQRVLDAAGLRLVVNYWTTQDATLWAPDSQGQVQLSTTVLGASDKRIVKVTRVAVVGPPTVPHGSNVVLLDDRGQFVVGTPFSYQTAFQLPIYPATTPGVSLTITVDLLVETAPGAGTYSRITQQDRLYLSTTPRVSSDPVRPTSSAAAPTTSAVPVS